MSRPTAGPPATGRPAARAWGRPAAKEGRADEYKH
jgi:hypothetical protein